jgi:hypothetical protein
VVPDEVEYPMAKVAAEALKAKYLADPVDVAGGANHILVS